MAKYDIRAQGSSGDPAARMAFLQSQLGQGYTQQMAPGQGLMGGTRPGLSQQAWEAYKREYDQLAARQAAKGGAAGSGNAAVDRIADDRAHIYADTEGRGDATLQDPRLTAMLDRLDAVATGKDVPYTDAVKTQMLARRGDMSAAAEAANAESLREAVAARGGSMADPSAQAMLRQGQAARQQQNQAAAGDLDTQAQLANFSARQQANGALGSARLAQLGEANSQYNRGAGFRAMESEDVGGHVNAVAPAWNVSGSASSSAPAAPTFGPMFVPSWGGGQQPAPTGGSSPWAGDNGGSVWAGSGQQNPAPVYGGPKRQPGQAAAAPPVKAPGTLPWDPHQPVTTGGMDGVPPGVSKQQWLYEQQRSK